MFDEIFGVLKSVVNGTETERKVQYYSGHDSTIIAVQGLLGIPVDSMVGLVKPGSGLALELHQNQNTSQFYLQVGRKWLNPNLEYDILFLNLHTG